MRAFLHRPMVPVAMAGAVIAIAVSARAVPARANVPAGQYAVTDGIVTDAKTKLKWQQTPGTPDKSQDAKTYCAGLGLGGAGWRLPTMKELQTLVDDSRTNPAIDPIFAMPTGTYLFPSSSPFVGLKDLVWSVSFKDGTAMYGSGTAGAVRCVR